MVLFAGMAVGFVLGIVVAALLSAPVADPGCDHCVLADGHTARRSTTEARRLIA